VSLSKSGRIRCVEKWEFLKLGPKLPPGQNDVSRQEAIILACMVFAYLGDLVSLMKITLHVLHCKRLVLSYTLWTNVVTSSVI
jgi:hypothetical protein